MSAGAAHLPDPMVRLSPPLERPLDLPPKRWPQPLREVFPRTYMQIYGVQQRSPHIMLNLPVRVVADAHRQRPVITGEMAQHSLGELPLTIDPVDHLEIRLALCHVGNEVEEVVGLRLEAERIQPPQAKGRVADPCVPVIPVALASWCLRQRRRRRGKHRASGGVDQSLQGECAALQVLAPRMIRKASARQPLAPELRRSLQPFKRLVKALRRTLLR